MFGNYYAYDSIGPVADSLQRILRYTDTQIGTLNAIYSFPNIVMVLIGGVIVDRFGAARATLAFAIIQAIGAVLTALSPILPGDGGRPPDFRPRRRIDDRRDHGRHRSVVRRAAARICVRPESELRAARLVRRGHVDDVVQAALRSRLAAAAVAGRRLRRHVCGRGRSSTTCSIAARRQRFALTEASRSDRIVWSDLWRFDRSYWYIVGLCVTFYSVIFPFRSTFAIKYFQHAHGLSLQEAGSMNAYVFLAAIFATPAFGLLADRVGRRSAFMALRHASPLCRVSRSRLHERQSVDVTVMIGIAFSLVPAVLWPAVPYLVERQAAGHGVRADDDAAEHRDDAGESRRRRVE